VQAELDVSFDRPSSMISLGIELVQSRWYFWL
jgi:hypothetical protein